MKPKSPGAENKQMSSSPSKTSSSPSPKKSSSSSVARPLRIKRDEFTGLVGTFGGNTIVHSSRVRFTPTKAAIGVSRSSTSSPALASVDRNRLSLKLTIDSKFKAKLRQTQEANLLHSVSNLVELNQTPQSPTKLTVASPVREAPDTPPASSPSSQQQQQHQTIPIQYYSPSPFSNAPLSPQSSTSGSMYDGSSSSTTTVKSTNSPSSSPASSLFDNQTSLHDLDNLTDLLQIPPSEFAMDLGDLFGCSANSGSSSAVVYWIKDCRTYKSVFPSTYTKKKFFYHRPQKSFPCDFFLIFPSKLNFHIHQQCTHAHAQYTWTESTVCFWFLSKKFYSRLASGAKSSSTSMTSIPPHFFFEEAAEREISITQITKKKPFFDPDHPKLSFISLFFIVFHKYLFFVPCLH